jgi:hypothetical protein
MIVERVYIMLDGRQLEVLVLVLDQVFAHLPSV